MTKLTSIQKKAIDEMGRYAASFTFVYDGIFNNYNQAKRCLNGLEKAGLAHAEQTSDGSPQYRLTEAGWDYVKYGMLPEGVAA
jgi:hypothetical protein